MDISTGQYAQLIIALFSGVVLFAVAYTTPVKYIIVFLLLVIPFQIISSRYGSINIVLIYLAGIALLLRGKIRLYPLFWAIGLISFAYLVSLSQVLRATYFDHLLYLVSVGANFVLFYIVYNYFRENGNPRFALNVFIWVAVLVDAYCLFSLLVGFDRVAFMGIQELSFGSNLEEKQRLVGPFDAPGTNAEFLALQILLLAYVLMHEKRPRNRILLLCLIAGSFAFLVATGSRGGFVALLGGAVLFFFLFRRELGAKGMFAGVMAAVGLGLVALTVVQFTEFNVLFERLGGTEFEGLMPDTREGPFELALERIPESPLVGHGPRIRLLDEDDRHIPGYKPFGGYPHSLYLFLLYTVGILGLLAYLIFFTALLIRWGSVRSCHSKDYLLNGLPNLAIILMLVFLASQLRIEFLRSLLNDYQNYMFALWGMFLAFSDILKEEKRKEVARSYTSREGGILSRKRAVANIQVNHVSRTTQ